MSRVVSIDQDPPANRSCRLSIFRFLICSLCNSDFLRRLDHGGGHLFAAHACVVLTLDQGVHVDESDEFLDLSDDGLQKFNVLVVLDLD